jgi:hypothetical protein
LGNLLLEIVASQFGDIAAAAEARKQLTRLRQTSDSSELVSVLEQILAGNSRSVLIQALSHPTDQAIVATIMNHMPRAND